MKRHGVSLRNHIITIYSGFVFLLILVAFVAWFEFAMDAIVFFGIVFLIDFLPALYLHLEYWRKNRGEEYVVTQNAFIRYAKGQEEVYNVDDIERFVIYRSASVDKGSWISFFTVENYHYTRLLLRSGGELIITCLLMPKMDEVIGQFKSAEIERKKRGFCTLRRR